MTKSTSIGSPEIFTKLWVHECSRVFYDRLINEEDREFFRDTVIDLVKSKFKLSNFTKEEIFLGRGQIIFSMLLRLDSEERLYEEILDKNKLFKVLEDKLVDYNMTKVNSKMDLVFFEDAINHICRISRILS
jgi:dynein heavy chain